LTFLEQLVRLVNYEPFNAFKINKKIKYDRKNALFNNFGVNLPSEIFFHVFVVQQKDQPIRRGDQNIAALVEILGYLKLFGRF
jgi:hypothetical protein